MISNILEIKKISKKFQHKNRLIEIFKNVTLNIKKGDLVDLIIYIGNIEFIFEWNPEDSEF